MLDSDPTEDLEPALFGPTFTEARFANGSSSSRKDRGGELRDGKLLATSGLNDVVLDEDPPATDSPKGPTEIEVEVTLTAGMSSRSQTSEASVGAIASA